jgi:glutamate synthase (ferredoxin)
LACYKLTPLNLSWLFFFKLQVTNPPIDPIREGEVMSLSMAIGRRGHVLNSAQDDDQATSLLMAQSPVLDGSEMTTLRNGKYVFALY